MIFCSFSLPIASVIALDPIVPNCGTFTPILGPDGKPQVDSVTQKPTGAQEIKNPCNFDSAMQLTNNVIDFLLKYLATPLAAIALCYAGAILIFSGGSGEKKTKAKRIILNVIIGYIIALAAWLIIHTILYDALGFKGETYLK